VEKAAKAKVKPPAVIVIGKVVNLREVLSGSK
jgi:siroheme synthase